jgi:tetratricopeptide (TPR) repeat protein
MSRYGKSAVARQMMESLAPSDYHGYDLAHAWLAANMIERAQRGEQTNVETLTHHLKHATSRDDVNPSLLIIYSQLLQRDDRISEAEQILKKAAQFDPRLLLSSIATYNRNGLSGQAKSAADLLVDTVKGKIAGEAGEDNRILTAQALVMTNRIDDGINVLQQGLGASGNSPKLRRALSDAFRIKFRSSLTNANAQVKVNLDLLNAAIVYDPTNIAVQEELGGLSNLGIGLNESSMNTLRAQIAASGTSFAARLLIAEASFRRGDIAGAVNQYEVVLAELPNMTLVLNNLSMMCTMLEPPRLEDALSFIDRAITISPKFPEFHDSRGEILVASNRKAEAIDEYLKALETSPDRVATRKKLISLYEELGPADQLQLQRDKLKEIESQLEVKQKQLEEAKRRQMESSPQQMPKPEASETPVESNEASTGSPTTEPQATESIKE